MNINKIEEFQYVIEDTDPDDLEKGINGRTFHLKLSVGIPETRAKKHDVIYCERKGVHLVVILEPLDLVNSLVYAVQIFTIDPSLHLDNKFLLPGTIYFKK